MSSSPRTILRFSLSVITGCFLCFVQTLHPQAKAASTSVEFVFVPGGTFEMGDVWGDSYSEDEKPSHPVTVSDFWMTRHEITNMQYCEFLNQMGNQFEGGATWLDLTDSDCLIRKSGGLYVPKKGYEEHPVVETTWYGARAFAEWLGGRLPTEAEWEYAARAGGRPIRFPNGAALNHRYANFSGVDGQDEWRLTSPVGRFAPNALGLCDMAGNVWERCLDWYEKEYYTHSALNDPEGPSSGQLRIIRGGSWDYSRWHCRTVTRGMNAPDDSTGDIGFRVVKSETNMRSADGAGR